MVARTPLLSLIVPAYNESARLGQSLLEISAYLAARAYGSEIVVVDDGSTDGTAAIARELAGRVAVPLRVLRYENNLGKGHALKVGFEVARGERILFSDADLSTPITHAEALLAALEAGADIAIGSRKRQGAQVVVPQPWVRVTLGKGFTWLVGHWLVDVSDVTCGFKAFRGPVGRDLFSRVRIFDWAFDAEVLMLARLGGHRVAELPVRWEDCPGTRVRLLRDVLSSLTGLVRMRVNAARGRYREPFPSAADSLTAWPALQVGLLERSDE